MLTWRDSAWDFKEKPPQIAILPLACLEPHGSHLPIGTDQTIVSEIALRVAAQLPYSTFLLPTWPLGMSLQHIGQAGTVSLGFETLWHVVRDIVLSLHEHNISNVAVINNHGSAMTSTSRPIGNFIVKTAIRQLNYETPGLTAIWVQPFAAAREGLKALFPSAGLEVHAGAVETSILMHLVPALVGPLPLDHVSDLTPAWMDFVEFLTIVPDGVWGNPSEASAEKGSLALNAIVKSTADYIEHSFTQISQIKATGID
jgi:creatinine amidohydrolase